MIYVDGAPIEQDHVDFDYRRTETWPDIGRARSLFVKIGDPMSGPAVQLGEAEASVTQVRQEDADRHHHGCDMFRVALKGEMQLSSGSGDVGHFAFQESGRPYWEGFGPSPDGAWIFMIMGRWRGARATASKEMLERMHAYLENAPTVRADGKELITINHVEQLDRPAEQDDPWWDDEPGGSKGVSAIDSTMGPLNRGYLWGSFDQPTGWQASATGGHSAAAVMGDATTGPVVLLFERGPGEVVLPASSTSTELLLLCVQGSFSVDGADYQASTVRVQSSDRPLGDVVAGPDGANVVCIVADRRVVPEAASAEGAGVWQELNALAEKVVSSVA